MLPEGKHKIEAHLLSVIVNGSRSTFCIWLPRSIAKKLSPVPHDCVWWQHQYQWNCASVTTVGSKVKGIVALVITPVPLEGMGFIILFSSWQCSAICSIPLRLLAHVLHTIHDGSHAEGSHALLIWSSYITFKTSLYLYSHRFSEEYSARVSQRWPSLQSLFS